VRQSTVVKDPDLLRRFQSTHPRGVRRVFTEVYFDNIRVSIHAPARGATVIDIIKDTFPDVSIHAPARGATYCPRPQHRHCSVSIHAPARGATLSWGPRLCLLRCFNPRTREGCDCHAVVSLAVPECFNPRTREGCDVRYADHGLFSRVSIHAPARGATACLETRAIISSSVSIHAPARGATLVVIYRQPLSLSFNPRTREGCDVVPDGRDGRGEMGFNPRTREGCDHLLLCFSRFGFKFQSTHPRGVRRCWSHWPTVQICCFNPRTREGCDRVFPLFVLHLGSFNPRTREGCDPPPTFAWPCSKRCFNPRTREGCDKIIDGEIYSTFIVSIHAPARGATYHPDIFGTQGNFVSIHAPARGATHFRFRKRND